jgi:triosephosphate isomerase
MSSRKKIVAGNWKMNLTVPEAEQLVGDVIKNSSDAKNVEKIFFPSLALVHSVISAAKNSGFKVGAQNCNEHDKGAFTGEVSATMLSSVGCEYVIVGHSERRIYFHEADAMLVLKLKRVLENKMCPVFCFGEQLTQRKTEKHFDTVGIQLHEVLKNFSQQEVGKMILAYEPVWAIGTGETATPAQAQEMHAFIRRTIKEMFDVEVALNIPILYGGSCNAQNAKELFSCADVDGGLIGGASLKAEDFCKIIHSF